MRPIDVDELINRVEELPILSIERGGIGYGDLVECINGIPTIGFECGGRTEIRELRERLAKVSKERDELRALMMRCPKCNGTGHFVQSQRKDAIVIQQCGACSGRGFIPSDDIDSVSPMKDKMPIRIMGILPDERSGN